MQSTSLKKSSVVSSQPTSGLNIHANYIQHTTIPGAKSRSNGCFLRRSLSIALEHKTLCFHLSLLTWKGQAGSLLSRYLLHKDMYSFAFAIGLVVVNSASDQAANAARRSGARTKLHEGNENARRPHVETTLWLYRWVHDSAMLAGCRSSANQFFHTVRV